MDEQRQEPGCKRIAPGVYLLAELLNSSKQANLFRSLQSVSTQMRYNPDVVHPTTESILTAGGAQSSIWKTPGVVNNDELLIPTRIVKMHRIEQMALLNTWKDDDLPIPFEWVDICDKAADLVSDILAPFFPALIQSNLCFKHEETRFRSDAKLPGWRIWVSLGCKANVIMKAGTKTAEIELLSGDALVMNTSPRYDIDVAVMSMEMNSCPPALMNLDGRLQFGRCNLVMAEEGRYARLRRSERMLRRTFEMERKKLWKKQAPCVE